MPQTPCVIGHNEVVYFPNYGVNHAIPAKIDTGADGCSVWASDISEDAAGLHFCLFDSGSVYYNSQIITSMECKTKRIKNSFGVTELRYSVKLSFTLGDKRYKTWFSLANRSHNHFPVLLGKKFLKNRYLVDVSRHHLLDNHTTPSKVLVLVKYATPKTRNFFKAMTSQTQMFTVLNYNNLVFSTIDTLRVTSGVDGPDLADHHLIYFKSHIANSELAGALATYFDYRNVVYRDTELASAVSQGKLTESVVLKAHTIASPPMLAMKPKLLLEHYDYIVKNLRVPFVLKNTLSNLGKDNYLINNQADFTRILQATDESAVFMAQQYIKNDGFIRVNLFGDQQMVIVQRTTAGHADPLKTHLNKPFGGGNASLVPLEKADPGMIELAQKAARAMRRQVAGVDMIQDSQTGQWFVLEVNNNPQIMTGSFVKEKAKAFANYINIELDRW